MQIYEVLVQIQPAEHRTVIVKAQESWVDEIMIFLLSESQTQYGEFTVQVVLSSGKTIPAMTGNPTKSDASIPEAVMPGLSLITASHRYRLPVNERNPYPHEIKFIFHNASDEFMHWAQILVVTEEKPFEIMQAKEERHAEIT